MEDDNFVIRNSMSNFRIKLHKCRVIFFDLEFYVPSEGRNKKGFCYNPWHDDHRLLGGSFLVANPQKDFVHNSKIDSGKVESLWLWDHESEKELLESIYGLIRSSYDVVYSAHQGKVSPVLCGIGISSSDVPILFELFKKHSLISNAEAFYFQNSLRVIDISQLSIGVFNNANRFMYPKTKKSILQKYLPERKFDDGKSVWDLYDSNNRLAIEDRVVDEVLCTYECYIKILEDFSNFKAMEKNKKRSDKLTLAMQ